jgi:hypothetical protein
MSLITRGGMPLLQAAFDPCTIHHFAQLNVGPGSNCVGVGAVADSIWKVRQSYVAVAPLETAAFDLVHARMLLGFVPNADAVLHHKVAALKPGGWLPFKGMDYSIWLPGGRQL